MKHLSINLIAIFVASQTLLTAQTNLDQYKYVSVPNRFDFMKSSDQYQISSLAKFLLTKNKFTVLENLEIGGLTSLDKVESNIEEIFNLWSARLRRGLR
mgnify:CR=1 FL=1